ncbi:MAG: DUF2937 family protein [Parvularculaceae bacterium]
MVARFLAGVAGIAGAVLGSQAPGFTLQYMQNLTGRVDELRPIVEQFDADVARYGYTREKALGECETSTGLLEALCTGYATTIRRFELLSAHLAELQAAGIYVRPILLIREAAENEVIRDISESVMKEFKPAVPVTLDGAAYAAGGFAVLWGGLSFIFGFLGAIFGGGRR